MGRYLGPKNKIARREGQDLGYKTPGTSAHASLLRRLKILPGMHGQKRTRKRSDYGLRLREKQKVKRIYGIREKQIRRYFQKAARKPTATGLVLLQLLESRLDNIVYRLGFTPTRAAARQLVSHRHVLINDKKINIPSYKVKVGEVIRLENKILEMPLVKKQLEEKNPVVPSWLERKGPVGKMVGLPKREEVGGDINEQLIVEFYSR